MGHVRFGASGHETALRSLRAQLSRLRPPLSADDADSLLGIWHALLRMLGLHSTISVDHRRSVPRLATAARQWTLPPHGRIVRRLTSWRTIAAAMVLWWIVQASNLPRT